MHLAFRQAEIKDIPQIQIVRHAVKENTLSDPALVTDADCAAYITIRGKGWVCEMENKIIGFAIADLKEKNIWALFIMPAYEGQGIGKKLHALMLNWYFSQTKETVWLGTAPETRAEKFYLKQGWQMKGIVNKGEVKFEMHYDDWLKKNVAKFNFFSFPELFTERLHLRQLKQTDAASLFRLRTDAAVNQFREKPDSQETAEAFIYKINSGIQNNSWIYWALTEKNDAALIGTIYLWNFQQENAVAETGYELFPEKQGKGLMHEALQKVTDFGFAEMGLNRIIAFTHHDNHSSMQLLMRNHFKRNAEQENQDDQQRMLLFTLKNPFP